MFSAEAAVVEECHIHHWKICRISYLLFLVFRWVLCSVEFTAMSYCVGSGA